MSDTETHQHTIAGLLHRRREIIEKIAAMRDQIGVMANDVEAIDRVLEELGYSGMLEAVQVCLGASYSIGGSYGSGC